jgi:hypothetical protein
MHLYIDEEQVCRHALSRDKHSILMDIMLPHLQHHQEIHKLCIISSYILIVVYATMV